MSEFAIISEGITDYQVIKNLLLGWFKDQSGEPFLKPYQPDPTAEGESAWQQFGSWENVMRYLSEKKYRDALEYAEYLIVQIDSDVSEHPNFGVPQQEGGRSLSPLELLVRVKRRLLEIIGATDVDFYGDRIIFAICVRQIECWLLPLWDPQKASKCEGCLGAVDLALIRADEEPLNKNPKHYDTASKGYKKRRILIEKGNLNPSLAIFLEELNRRNITIETD